MFPIRDHNPSERTPYVTLALIVANVAVFAMSLAYMQNDRALAAFWSDWALIPVAVTSGHDLQGVVTSMFLHAGVLHLAGNMLFLWIFGDNMENEMGHVGFLAFYLACGIAAAGAHLLSDPFSPVPTVGASGAIAGVMGGYLLLFPRARVDVLIIFVVFFRVIAVPAWITLGVWFALQLFNGASTGAEAAGVAYWAHAGGFAAGIGLTLFVWVRRGATRFWKRNEGHPPHPAAAYRPSVPIVRRRR